MSNHSISTSYCKIFKNFFNVRIQYFSIAVNNHVTVINVVPLIILSKDYGQIHFVGFFSNSSADQYSQL